MSAGSIPVVGTVRYQPPQPTGQRRRLLLVAFMAIAATVVALGPRAPVAQAENTLLPESTAGLSCSGFSTNWLHDDHAFGIPANPATVDVQLLCALNPVAGTDTHLAQWIAGTAGCGALVATCGATGWQGGGSYAALLMAGSGGYAAHTCNGTGNYIKIGAHGAIVNSVGTQLVASNDSTLSTNSFYVDLRCKGNATSFYVSTCATDCNVQVQINFSSFGAVGTSNVCGETDGGVGTPANQTYQVCYGTADLAEWAAFDHWPDYWEESSPAAPPCDGVGFVLREDGVSLSGSLAGVNASEDSTYWMRFLLPTSGEADTLTFWFDADAGGDTVGPRYLGSATIPAAASPGYVQWDVTRDLVALEDPTPDLGEIQAQCRSNNQVGGKYWSGDTGESDLIPPLDPLEPDDEQAASLGACFTFDGMSLTSPSSWVKGIGSMLVCLAQVLFIPSDSDLAAFVEDVDALTAEPPLQWIVEGIDYVEGASFSFGTWDAVGPDCITVLGFESCPSEWDDGISTPSWLVSVMLFGLWTGTLVGIWRFFS